VDVTVWVDDWQMACCGEPFSIGSEVSWTVGRSEDPGWLAALVGQGATVTVDAFEDHHVGLPEDTPATTGTVTDISAVYCRYESRPGADSARYQVDGTGVLVPVTRADHFRPAWGESDFIGYLVRLAIPPP
jgi:hypothetical protein